MLIVKDKYRMVLLFLLILSAPLSAAPPSYLLPINRDIGQIVEPEETGIEHYAQRALASPYSLAWVDAYVPPSLAAGFVHTYNDLLSSLLPASGIQMGRAVQRTHLWEVGFAVTEPTYRWGSMVWMDQSDGRWALLSISISE